MMYHLTWMGTHILQVEYYTHEYGASLYVERVRIRILVVFVEGPVILNMHRTYSSYLCRYRKVLAISQGQILSKTCLIGKCDLKWIYQSMLERGGGGILIIHVSKRSWLRVMMEWMSIWMVVDSIGNDRSVESSLWRNL